MIAAPPILSEHRMKMARSLDEHLARLKEYETVHYPAERVSQKPIASLGFETCCAIALFDGKNAGLAHLFDTEASNPCSYTAYIQQMRRQMSSLPRAVVCGLDDAKVQQLAAYCRMLDIPIADHYSYNFNDQPKDILVLPESAQVRIYMLDALIVKRF